MFSCEGTTQGDPLAMAMYAIALQPLITHLDGFAVQVWYADDASCAGSVVDVKAWWDEMVVTGGCFGYNVNPRKTWLIVKESQYDVAVEMFKSSSIQITTHGKRHLGAALGHRSLVCWGSMGRADPSTGKGSRISTSYCLFSFCSWSGWKIGLSCFELSQTSSHYCCHLKKQFIVTLSQP